MHFAVHVDTGHLRRGWLRCGEAWMAALLQSLVDCFGITQAGACHPLQFQHQTLITVFWKLFTSTPISAHTFTEHKIQWEMIINYFLLYLLLFLQCSSSPVKVCNTSSANIQVSVLLGLGVWREQRHRGASHLGNGWKKNSVIWNIPYNQYMYIYIYV